MNSIDIERLLQWAYRDELSKRATSSAEAIWEHVADVGRYGIAERPSGSQRYDHGAPHRDALIIEHAVARLPDAVIDWEEDAERVLGHLTALVEPRSAPAEPAARETRVSWSTRSGARKSAQLEAPREVILVRTLRTGALVTMHARMGTRPDWREEHPQVEPVPAPRGPHALVVGYAVRKGWYSEGSYCPVRWYPSPIAIAEARADYLCWWRGLARLAEELVLSEHAVTSPQAPETPWR
jgi:hypothetical protein